MNLNLLELLKILIDLDSTTGKEESVGEFISDYFQKQGLVVQRQTLSDNRFNLFVFIQDPVLVFTSHLDTVPDYFPFSEDDRYIYGRGACDAKGILAAQIKAGEQLIREGHRETGFLFVVGEEYGSEGAKAANTLRNRCRFLIGGEPTENKLALGSKGALRISIETQGVTAHSAYPETGESAILKMLDVLQSLKKIELPVHEVLGSATMNIGTLSGGTQANIVPVQARSEIVFRTVSPANTLKSRIQQIMGARASWRIEFECEPIFFRKLEGFECTVVSFTTDLPILSNWGEPFLIGPGSILDAHTAHEKISKIELERGSHLYYQLAKRCLEGNTLQA